MSQNNLTVAVSIHDKRFYRHVLFLRHFCKKVIALAWQDNDSPVEVSVVLTDDKEIHQINKRFRHKDCPTNVLSFETPRPVVGPWLAGDIIISYDTVHREALAEHKCFKGHLAHMLIHGALHLQGYDHLTDKQAHVMEHKEKMLLQKLFGKDVF